jgi:acetyl esterase/lipase
MSDPNRPLVVITHRGARIMAGIALLIVLLGVIYEQQSGRLLERHGRVVASRLVPPTPTGSPALTEDQAQPLQGVEAMLATVPKTEDAWRLAAADSAHSDVETLRRGFPDVTIETGMIAGVPVYLLERAQSKADPMAPLIMHLHGGAYVFGGGDGVLPEAVLLAHYSGMNVVSVDYRMPPDTAFPGAVDDAEAVWQELVKRHPGARMGIGGTSAGGGLTLATVLRLKADAATLPDALFCGTPWADLTFQGDTIATNDGIDDVLPTYRGQIEAAAILYAGGADRRDPLISPVFGDFSGFPPTILVSGTRDLLLSDTVRVHRRLRHAGVEAELHVFEGLSHAGYLLLPQSPEAIDAWTEIGAFFRRVLRSRD